MSIDNFDWASISLGNDVIKSDLPKERTSETSQDVEQLVGKIDKAYLMGIANRTRNKLQLVESKIALAESNRANYEVVKAKLENVNEFLEEAESYRRDLARLRSVTSNEANTFRNNRLGFLGEAITDRLATIFPYDGKTCEIIYDTKRGKQIAYAELTNKHGDKLIPAYTAGGLEKELIGFTAASTIVQCLGSSIFIFDEAFSMASEKIKAELGLLLEDFANKGIQIFLISQSDELYKDIKCRCIYIYRDPVTNSVRVEKTVDKEGMSIVR